MPDLVTLPLHCPHCGKAVTVRVEPSGRKPKTVRVVPDDPGEDLAEGEPLSVWICPYCQKLNHAKLGGILVGVTKGHISKATH